jgi:tetratricopeptide (TPR) repeat protein
VISRALQRLDAAIAAAGDPASAACLRAERAGLLARMGDIDGARTVLGELRAQHERMPQPSLAAWLSLIDGLIDHFDTVGRQARERIARAHALAAAARDRPLLALSAAWLAAMDYANGDLPGVARHVAEALQEAADDHHAARSRACVVVAQSYHWGGRLDLAQPWYQRAREHAAAEGDEATLSALMANRAWIIGEQLRLASILGEGSSAPDSSALRQALIGAESTGNYDQHVGKSSLRWWLPMLRAQLLLAQGRHAEALAMFDVHMPIALDEGLAYMSPVLYADLAWCRVRLGHKDAALVDARVAEAGFSADCEPEDRAGAHGRLAQVFGALGLAEDARSHAAQAAEHLQALRGQQAQLVCLLDAALAQVPGLPVPARR